MTTQQALPLNLPTTAPPSAPPPVPAVNPGDLALAVFDAGITRDQIWAHATQLLADPDARPDPACLLCVAGLATGAWPTTHHPTGANPVTSPTDPHDRERLEPGDALDRQGLDPGKALACNALDVDHALAAYRTARQRRAEDPATYSQARRALHHARRTVISHHAATSPQPLTGDHQ